MSHAGNLKGAEREMLVSVDLLRRGFEVFRPVCATSCDVLALKYGITLRIEVKGPPKGYRNPSGPVAGLPTRHDGGPDCQLFDVLVRCSDDGEMCYQRSILHTINKASAELPLREEVSKSTTKKNLRRANQLENECQS